MGQLPERNVRIAVVDDDEAFLDLAVWLFHERGWQVLPYLGDEDTFLEIARAKPDLIILDIQLQSEQNGWRILSLLEADPRTYGIPIIICSAALRDVADRENALARRGIPFLPKPFDIDDLYRLADAALLHAASHRKTGA